MDMTNVDKKILQTITELRQEFNACTARAVAGKIRMNPDAVRYRMNDLRNKGLVQWNALPGSLIRTDNALGDQQFIAAILKMTHIPEVQQAIDSIYLAEHDTSNPDELDTSHNQTVETQPTDVQAEADSDDTESHHTEPETTTARQPKPRAKTPKKRASNGSVGKS